MLCYLFSIVNKILPHVIWNSFNFYFIKKKKKKRPNISGIVLFQGFKDINIISAFLDQ